jgi:putative ABC transport system permease protein
MLKSYILTALRHFRKDRLHASINILGLGLGLMVSLLALVFMMDEQSFDIFHTKGDRIYRLNKSRVDPSGTVNYNAESSGLYGPGMLDEFPEIENFVRYQPWFNSIVLTNKDRNIELKEQESLFVDNSFFEIFDFELLRGDKSSVLIRPSTIVLTPELANALFGTEDPV